MEVDHEEDAAEILALSPAKGHPDFPRPCPNLSLEAIAAGARKVFSAEPSLIPGEIMVSKCPNVISQNPFHPQQHTQSEGTIFISNFKLSFIQVEQSSYLMQESPSYQSGIDTSHSCEVPLSAIYKVYSVVGSRRRELARRQPLSGAMEFLEVLSKDFRRLVYDVRQTLRSSLESCVNALLFYGFPANILQLFFFDSALVIAKRNRKRPNGTGLYDSYDDWEKELVRLHASRWRMTEANQDYNISQTLPCYFPVPKGLTDVQVLNVAASHNLCRLPIWAWTHPETGASLATCATVLLGISKPDKSLEVAMSSMTGSSSQVQILDLDETCSPRADLDTSFIKLRQLHTPASVQEMDSGESSYLSSLEATGWIKHISAALMVASEVTRVLFLSRVSVILEESEGRDLTCLISSLVQLLSDPHYRTLSGFQLLIQKAWIAHGHPFCVRTSAGQGQRSRTPSSSASPLLGTVLKRKTQSTPSSPTSANVITNTDEFHEPSSVFLLFLDCVWQLLQQFPSTFQFSAFYLEELWEQVFSAEHCSFTFSGYNHLASVLDMYEESPLIRSDLMTVWDVLKHRPLCQKVCYVNPLYRFSSVLSQQQQDHHQEQQQEQPESPQGDARSGVRVPTATAVSITPSQHYHEVVRDKKISQNRQVATACGKPPARLQGHDSNFLQPSVKQGAITVWTSRYLRHSLLPSSLSSSSYSLVIRKLELVTPALQQHERDMHLAHRQEQVRQRHFISVSSASTSSQTQGIRGQMVGCASRLSTIESDDLTSPLSCTTIDSSLVSDVGDGDEFSESQEDRKLTASLEKPEASSQLAVGKTRRSV